MKKTSFIYFIIALLLVIYLMAEALPFLRNLIPGARLFLLVFPVIFLLLTHYTPREMGRAFLLAGRESRGSTEEYRNALQFFQAAQNIFVVLMLIAAVMLVIFFLGIGPQSRHIAQPVAIIVGGFFWPLIFILFICLPFKSALLKNLHRDGGEGAGPIG